MGGAADGSCRNKAVDGGVESFAFTDQVALVGDQELRVGGSIAADRGIVFEDERLDEPADDPEAQPGAPWLAAAGHYFERQRTVRHGLGSIHLAPESRAIGSQAIKALLEFLGTRRIE